ncbi:MAG: protein-disulfide reductase DsbD domain-containing protein [Vicinamibacterales bacterium]
MRTLLLALAVSSTAVLAQTAFRSTLTAANPHLSLRAIVDPEVVSPGSELTITFNVTPGRRIHVYAPGAEYQVVAVKVDPQPGLKARDIVYPPSEIYHFEPLDERVPVYMKPFALKQAIAVSPQALKGKDALTLSGKFEYQACDDRVCFKPNAIPFKFELRVKR